MTARESSEPQGSHKKSEKAVGVDVDLVPLVDVLKRKRQRKRMTLASLARRAHVSVDTIQRFEGYQINSIGLRDLLSIAVALGSKLNVQLVAKKHPLPNTDKEILREFDAVIRGPNCNPFVRKQPDKEHADLFWDIVGDKKRNWLFVVVTHRNKRNLRFGCVTNEPGGWAIAGQVWGIDFETDSIARKMSDQLFKEHRAALLGGRGRRRKNASNG